MAGRREKDNLVYVNGKASGTLPDHQPQNTIYVNGKPVKMDRKSGTYFKDYNATVRKDDRFRDYTADAVGYGPGYDNADPFSTAKSAKTSAAAWQTYPAPQPSSGSAQTIYRERQTVTAQQTYTTGDAPTFTSAPYEAAPAGTKPEKEISGKKIIIWILVLTFLFPLVMDLIVDGIEKIAEEHAVEETTGRWESADGDGDVFDTAEDEGDSVDTDDDGSYSEDEYDRQQAIREEQEAKMQLLLSDGSVQDSKTGEITKVTADTLGSDIQDNNFELDGVLYQFPAAVSSFEENGWTLVEEPYSDGDPDAVVVEETVEPGHAAVAYLENPDRVLLTVNITNYSQSETAPISECAVTGISVIYDYATGKPQVTFVPAGGLDLDAMNEKSFGEFIKAGDLDKMEDRGGYYDFSTYDYDGFDTDGKKKKITSNNYSILFPYREGHSGEGEATRIQASFDDGEAAWFLYGISPSFYPQVYEEE